jgi:hypothetical protein
MAESKLREGRLGAEEPHRAAWTIYAPAPNFQSNLLSGHKLSPKHRSISPYCHPVFQAVIAASINYDAQKRL